MCKDINRMVEFQIEDARIISAFKKFSFCGFTKKDTIHEFIKELLASNVEHSCFWCAELICSGLFKECWDTLMLVYGKHIGIKNPKMAIYLFSKVKLFKQLANESDNILSLRNDATVRELFTEIVAIICFSIKDNGYEPLYPQHYHSSAPPYEHKHTFNLKSNRFKDPPTVVLELHELYCILTSEVSTSTITPLALSTFWIEFLMEKGKHILCESRETDVGYEKHMTWAIWDIIKMACVQKNDNTITKSICALEYIYKLKFKNPDKIFKERKYILFCACDHIINNIDWNIQLVHPQFINQIKKHIEMNNFQYKKILEVYAKNINRLFAEHAIKA
jgi:hypothetical protein